MSSKPIHDQSHDVFTLPETENNKETDTDRDR